MNFCMKDSSGRESKTLFFVTISWLVLVLKFALAGWSLKFQVIDIVFAPMTATEFGLAFAGVIGIWLGHEWAQKPTTPAKVD